MGNATLIVHRAGGYADMVRKYRILVNGEELGRIKRNSKLQLTVPTGRITVEGKIDWTSSQPLLLDLRAGETAEIDISNTHGAIAAGWAITGGMDTYLTLRLRENI